MPKDRGTIKWTSLMLPEHVQLLKEMWQEDQKIDQPNLDSQALELMNEELMIAYVQKQTVTLTYYDNGQQQSVYGTIVKLDQLNQAITLQSAKNRHTVLFDALISLTVP